MAGYLTDVITGAMAEIEKKSKKRIYQNDFDAWAADVLGRKYYEKIREVNADLMLGQKTHTAVKSANGCGKSLWLADYSTFWVTAFPPEESLAIITAPTLHQIQNVIFKYLKDNYGYVLRQTQQSKEPFPWPGWINESLEWKYQIPGVGNENIVFGKRPSDKDIVSTFQGTRKNRTLVAIDEGGGVPTDLFTAAEAVATGGTVQIVTIGNPDKRGTEFHRIFTVPNMMREWNLHTISAYDLPTMTGEIVYPGEPEKQAQMLNSGMTTREWIEHKERVWQVGGKWDARGLAKVLGEFPGETDNTFFPQEALDASHEADIDPAGAYVTMGVDLASSGDDESVVYVNRGGNVRLFEKEIHYDDGGEDRTTTGVWSKEDEVTSARRVHAIAQYLGVDEVRLDSAGMGSGVFKMLERLDEFTDKQYTLFAIQGANSSNDRDRWDRRKEENYDNLRRQLVDGLIDLDPNDAVLRDEILLVTYGFNNRGAIKITPKKEMRSQFGGSPDRLDALIYATVDVTELFGPQPGQTLNHDIDEEIDSGGFYYGNEGISSFGW